MSTSCPMPFLPEAPNLSKALLFVSKLLLSVKEVFGSFVMGAASRNSSSSGSLPLLPTTMSALAPPTPCRWLCGRLTPLPPPVLCCCVLCRHCCRDVDVSPPLVGGPPSLAIDATAAAATLTTVQRRYQKQGGSVALLVAETMTKK